MGEAITVVPADEDLLTEYDALATRAFGRRIDDVTQLAGHADIRVALHGGRVIAGGLGMLIAQHFGGRPVPSACLGSGCVAPEYRGDRLTVRMLNDRIRPLQEQGAVLASLWTSSNGYARRMGWEAPVPVFSWSVQADALKRDFAPGDLDIEHGLTPDSEELQRRLAPRWNGTLLRPTWWTAHKQRQHDLTFYRFNSPSQPTAGYLSLATRQHDRHGAHLDVHDFWAADDTVASAMLAFLGRHNSRIPTINFQRTSLPPHPLLLHGLHHYGNATTESWHPWMLRILDLPEAVRLRGWPADLDTTLPIGVEQGNGTTDRYLLQIAHGAAELQPTTTEPRVTVNRRQATLWYAGGYRSTAAASMAGVRATDEQSLATLIRSTTEHELWCAEHF
ncbi:GNAT family N-acetyltransferase [Streptomyces europaeiscabiei]|uniref:GNAT family N-acetyltransferase n=1 Tax=Streptomyces europaeiscabiei TaxID=146819 RepID=UPI0029BD8C7A|nr:GNAT family N-acetyltransferase [Streptomyces europaeiscabiei]MDX3697802.1 GNAT family N-acetyltransferase [Streptomyces europaeiscabiei]